MPGILTHAVPKSCVTMQNVPEGRQAQIGVYDPALPGSENKMRVCPALEEQAVPMIRQLADSAGEWAFVDEIGYLECSSPSCMNALNALFDRKRVIAAVRKQDVPFLQEVTKRPDVFCVDLDAPFGHMGCVIMASGLSKRFGGNKLLADFHGEPMVRRILNATEGVFHRRVVVTRHPEIAGLCRADGIDVILHDLPHRSDTVRLGLEALGDVDGCLFCPADQPLLRRETIASLVLSAMHDPSAIWRPCFEETPGSPVLFPRWAFEQLLRLPEGKGGGYLIRQYPDRVRTLPIQNQWELTDADDRETLEVLLNIALDKEARP